jgi:hypothetical protein
MKRQIVGLISFFFLINIPGLVFAVDAKITTIKGNEISVKNLKCSHKNTEIVYGVWKEAQTGIPFNKMKELTIFGKNDKLPKDRYGNWYIKSKIILRTGKTIEFNFPQMAFFGISTDLGSEVRIKAKDVKNIKFPY